MSAIRNIFLFVFSALLVQGCDYNRFPDVDFDDPTEPQATMTIARMRSFYSGKPMQINSLVAVVSGYVTSTDREGNFFRSFFLQDSTGAVEIREGGYDLHNHYKLGQRVTVLVNGMTMGMLNGTLQLGRPNLLNNGQQTDFIDHKPTAKAHLLRRSEFDTLAPIAIRVSQLTDQWIGRLVCVENLALLPEADTTWALPAHLAPGGVATEGNLLCFASDRDSIYVSTSGYATFAGGKVPRGRFSVTGILYKVKNEEVYQLKMRSQSDVEDL